MAAAAFNPSLQIPGFEQGFPFPLPERALSVPPDERGALLLAQAEEKRTQNASAPERPKSAPPDENEGSLHQPPLDDRVRACYLVSCQCGHQSVEPQPGKLPACPTCFSTSHPLYPDEHFSRIRSNLHILPCRSTPFSTAAKELLEVLETFSKTTPLPQFRKPPSAILHNLIQSDELRAVGSLITCPEQNSSDPIISMERLFKSLESCAQYVETLKELLQTAQNGETVLIPVLYNDFLIELRKNQRGFDARVYTIDPVYIAIHTPDRGKQGHYFPVEYTGIANEDALAFVETAALLSFGNATWTPGLGNHFETQQEAHPEERLHEMLERIAQGGKTREGSHLLSYGPGEDRGRLIDIWFKQHAFEHSAENWYRRFRTALHEHRLGVLNQWAQTELPEEVPEDLFAEVLKAQNRALILHHRKEERVSWTPYLPPRPARHARTRPIHAQALMPVSAARAHYVEAANLEPTLPRTELSDRRNAPAAIFQVVHCGCDHMDATSLPTGENPFYQDRCYHCAPLSPISIQDIQGIVEWDVGCLHRIHHMKQKSAVEAEPRMKQILQFEDRMRKTHFDGEDYLRTLLSQLEQFQGPEGFPKSNRCSCRDRDI